MYKHLGVQDLFNEMYYWQFNVVFTLHITYVKLTQSLSDYIGRFVFIKNSRMALFWNKKMFDQFCSIRKLKVEEK